MTKKENVRSNDIKIEQIIINLDTSIPIDIKKEPDPNNEESSSKNEESETRIIKLTSNVLYHPKLKKMIGLSLYPYITSSIKFPVNYLKNVLSNDEVRNKIESTLQDTSTLNLITKNSLTLKFTDSRMPLTTISSMIKGLFFLLLHLIENIKRM